MTDASAGEPPWRELRAELAAEGFRPTKDRGQNFLVDPNLARAIARDARVGAGDRVLEVGPGCGFLTVPLVELGVDILAVEIEPILARVAARRVQPARVRFLVTDVLAGKRALAPAVQDALWSEGAWHLVSNLPYAIAGPLLAVLAALSNPPRSMTVLVQREVAERLAARPGDAAWSGLSARLAVRYRGALGREVAAGLFWPRPRVASRVARLERRDDVAASAQELSAYDELVAGLFQRRRKTLRTGLGAVLGDREAATGALARAGIDPQGRPERLSVDELLALVRALGSVGGG